jgi:3'-5' exoribonuclease
MTHIVQDVKITLTSTGKEMANFTVVDPKTGDVHKAVMWEGELNTTVDKVGTTYKKMLKNGTEVKLLNSRVNPAYGTLNVFSFKIVKAPMNDLPDERKMKCLNTILEVKEGSMSWLEYLLNKMGHTIEEFMQSPAAKSHHHNYKGGLLEHTYECLAFFNGMATEGNISTRELTVIRKALVAHDLYKIEEYKLEDSVEVNEQFITNKISHTVAMTGLLQSLGLYEIASCVAGHHGKIEWGSLLDLEKNTSKLPLVTHLVDRLSASGFGFGRLSDLEV